MASQFLDQSDPAKLLDQYFNYGYDKIDYSTRGKGDFSSKYDVLAKALGISPILKKDGTVSKTGTKKQNLNLYNSTIKDPAKLQEVIDKLKLNSPEFAGEYNKFYQKGTDTYKYFHGGSVTDQSLPTIFDKETGITYAGDKLDENIISNPKNAVPRQAGQSSAQNNQQVNQDPNSQQDPNAVGEDGLPTNDPSHQYDPSTGAPNPNYDPNAQQQGQASASGQNTAIQGMSGPSLGLGSRGTSVSQLQQALGGIAVDGSFGPQTLAAVKSFQLAHGLKADGIVGPQTQAAMNTPSPVQGQDVFSGFQEGAKKKVSAATGGIPSTGNPEIDALLNVLNNQSPQKSFADVYKESYKAFGVGSMSDDYNHATEEYSDLQNEKNDKKDLINNNPWYSEGVRVEKLRQLDKKYEGKELILQNKLSLLETNISNARSDAQFMAGQVMDQLEQSSKLNQDIILKAIDIAETQAKAESPAKPTSVQEYEYAKAEGYTGTYTQYQNEDANRKAVGAGGGYKPPTSYQEWELAGKPGTYADYLKDSNTKAPTAGQQTVATYTSRIEQSNPIIGNLGDKIAAMNPVQFELQKNLPSYLQSADYQAYDQASRNFINAVLRRESGAVISPSEFQNAYSQYLPKAGDTAQTMAQKKANRDVVYASLKKAAGNAYQSVDDLLGTNSGKDPMGLGL